tara:strand:- start:689 stop:1147 length:459 start_codon:yes stop_codon:yes gene_type:complete
MSGKILTRVNSEGHIITFYRTGPLPPIEEGTVDGITTVYVDQSEASISNLNLWVDTHYYKDGEWKERSEPPGDWYDWKNEAWTPNTTVVYEKIRRQRHILLHETDWTQFADSPLSDEKKAEWAAYRKILRDIPEDQSTLDHPNAVVWPSKPS